MVKDAQSRKLLLEILMGMKMFKLLKIQMIIDSQSQDKKHQE